MHNNTEGLSLFFQYCLVPKQYAIVAASKNYCENLAVDFAFIFVADIFWAATQCQEKCGRSVNNMRCIDLFLSW